MMRIVLILSFLTAVSYGINPIIIVPGLAASQVTYSENPDVVDCAKDIPNHERLWINIKYFLYINCLTEKLSLAYDPSTKLTSNPPGISLKFPGWGKTNRTEYLGFRHIPGMKYFRDVVSTLVNKCRFKRGLTIRAAPYDFRKAPKELKNYRLNLKALIEETYSITGNKKVNLIGHSYGTLQVLGMLQNAKQSWKDKYIKYFISVGGPYYGSMVTLRMMVMGYNPGIPTAVPIQLRKMQRSWPSGYFLLPSQKAWTSNETILRTPSANYTVNDYERIFTELAYNNGLNLYRSTRGLMDPTKPPRVNVICVVGRGLPTDSMIDCSKAYKWPTDVIGCTASKEDGDGTVPWRSLRVCEDWAKNQSQEVSFRVLDSAEHLDVLFDDRFINMTKAPSVIDVICCASKSHLLNLCYFLSLVNFFVFYMSQ